LAQGSPLGGLVVALDGDQARVRGPQRVTMLEILWVTPNERFRFAPRPILQIAPAVVRAAGQRRRTRPTADFDAYRAKLELFVYRSLTEAGRLFPRQPLARWGRIATVLGWLLHHQRIG